MKTKILVFSFLFCVLFGTAALAQVSGSVLNGDIGAGISFTSHSARASQPAATLEQDLLERSTNVSGHGERPLWEFAQPKQEVPLGDVAREYRKQRASAKVTPAYVHQN